MFMLGFALGLIIGAVGMMCFLVFAGNGDFRDGGKNDPDLL